MNKLDNPAWYSLNETHKDFVVDYEQIKFYDPDYCPFGGTLNNNQTKSGIATYASLTDSFFIIGNRPDITDEVRVESELVCNQMVLDKRIDIDIQESIIELQTEIHRDDLFKLVNLVQPGYFKNKTADLGSYYGIYKNHQLVAVAGERMKMDGYTELSAIVTHPEHTGKGYSKQLIVHASNKIFNESTIPYLHVADNNVNAIRLYDKLGFLTRKKISFWKLHANVL
ncbi:ribosomal protein S18 acetylase RimI-like enzyme [Chryseobacterium sp. H1D6B]|uniref:GNAT family N-acetyltransferase n=1 Tax=Chryseobacterium sp. H1D6B TaxID=2940588 RepID=UPI0024740E4F|nr:GNAT family N-acetyltransferase [Chryseobacterium sp. H1D6B]MDH6252416.1 ribosomal protein S18 acetylase RimI-like enzyme [Chryseobacterium sp. H1D6B]